MTVCIAAIAAVHKDPSLVFCMDMMGSMDAYGAETAWKMHGVGEGFWALIAGPISEARELAYHCENALGDVAPNENIPSILAAVRKAIGAHRRAFAESHILSRLGITYDDFVNTGKSSLPEELYRELFYEIKMSADQVELIVAGFYRTGLPVIIKASGGSAWTCDDFAVIGTGTSIGESSLFNRSQSTNVSIDRNTYHVYEAKKLAERALGVCKKTKLSIFKADGTVKLPFQSAYGLLDQHFTKFSPQPVSFEPFPDSMFQTLKSTGKSNPQSSKRAPKSLPPSPE